ncbi:hemerythrin domain-containing protein [Geodermatophilus sp. SYSU D00815]
MTATAVLPSSPPRPAPAPGPTSCRAVAHQRVLHQLVRRELRTLAELATWAPAAEPARTAALTRHADLVARVLLHHHRVERELLWPALQQALPGDAELPALVAEWTTSCGKIDHALRDLSTAARQWAVAETCPARDSFAMACLDLADAVDAQTAREEQVLHPLLAARLDASVWAGIARSVRSDLSPREQTLVLGLALEDACATDRARLLSGLPAPRRWAWRLVGRGRYRAAVVRLRGAPPAL